MNERNRFEGRVQVLLFAVVLVVHFQSEVETPFDSGWSIQVASSLVVEGDIDLDEFPNASAEDYRVLEVDGRLLPRYPVAPSVAVLPLYVATKSLVKAAVGFSLDIYYRSGGPTAGMERWLSSVLVALCAVLVYRLARRELPCRGALLVAFVFAFATSAWSVVSRALWQHAPSMVCTTLALLALTGNRRGRFFLAGVAIAAAYTMRPTNVWLVLAVTAWVAWRELRRLPQFLAGAACVGVPFVAANLAVWHQPLPPYFMPGGGNTFRLATWGEGLAGTLVSPGRGLFVYSPVLLFCLVGVVLRLRDPARRTLAAALLAAGVAQWLMVSAWFAWWGGEVFGPRLFADLLPVAAWFLVPAIAALHRALQGAWYRRREGAWHRRSAAAATAAALFVASLAWSVWVHQRGANVWATWDWNVEPNRMEEHPERLWDWRDPPFLRQTSRLHPRRRRA